MNYCVIFKLESWFWKLIMESVVNDVVLEIVVLVFIVSVFV